MIPPLNKDKENTMIEVHDLHAQAGGQAILKGVDLRVGPGEVHALVGPNGSGKSSLAAVLAGHPGFEITQGDVRVDGDSWANKPADERARAGFFLAVQKAVVFPGVPTMTFLREVVNAHRTARGEGPLDAADALRSFRHAARQVGLPDEHLRRAFNDGFSGGEAKRLELMQILLLQPQWIVLDEIDAGMDVDALQTTVALLRGLLNGQRSLLVISHQARLLDELPVDRVHVMKDGRIVESGEAALLTQVQRDGFAAWDARSAS